MQGGEEEILKTCERLAGFPELGHFRKDITDKPVASSPSAAFT
jgi:hypothetical protein